MLCLNVPPDPRRAIFSSLVGEGYPLYIHSDGVAVKNECLGGFFADFLAKRKKRPHLVDYQ